mgnify:CR=1 FL=1|jgi:hypothetical protein
MNNNKWVIRITFVLALVVGISALANAQSVSATGTTPIRATKAETISISAGGLTPFDLLNLSSQTLTISSNWNLTPQRTSVSICAYMDPTNGIMKGTGTNTDTIDQNMVQTKVGAGAWGNIDAGTGCAISGGATLVKSYTMGAQNTYKNVSNTDTVLVQLNGVPASLSADTYTGTITVMAYAQ